MVHRKRVVDRRKRIQINREKVKLMEIVYTLETSVDVYVHVSNSSNGCEGPPIETVYRGQGKDRNEDHKVEI